MTESNSLRDKVREEIRVWTYTQFPKNQRVGSASWIDGLTNRILAVQPRPHTFTCTSGLGDKCTCYACHGG